MTVVIRTFASRSRTSDQRGKRSVFAASTLIPNQRRAATFAGAAVVLLHLGAITPAHSAGGEAIKISDAWVHAAEQVGGNVVLSMTIKNEADVADTLLRVRCPVANFSAKHTIDRGEGSPAMREIPSIPIAASSMTVLKPDAYHVMLLQTRQALAAGEAFNCSIVFQKAGTIETEVKVHGLP
jgi:periplasmic copper chaperone A